MVMINGSMTHKWVYALLMVVGLVGARLEAASYERLFKAVGENDNDWFGHSVSYAGDVNGDGYADIIVGAPGFDYGSNINVGAVYIYFGGPSMDTIYDVRLAGENAGDVFGASVSYAGDVNGDGYADIIVGAYGYDDGSNSDAGAAYIYYGGPSMDATYDVKLVGENAYDHFGISVSYAGDVNEDGFDDVIVGAYGFDNGSNTNAGAAYIYFGGPSMDSLYDVRLVGGNIEDYFGGSVSYAGDINGDGFDDVIVGAYGFDNGSNTNAGAAYIYFGGPSMDAVYDLRLVGENAFDLFGYSVSYAGDVNGDGYADVIVGAYGYNDYSNIDAGAAYIYHGGLFMDTVYDIRLVGENISDHFGSSVSYAGDVNGDGFGDVIVGAEGYDNGSISDAGAAYIYYGSSFMDAAYDARLVGENPDDKFGTSVSYAGDVNGDGYADIIVGAESYGDGSNSAAGAAYIYDFYLYRLVSPNGGETWHVGADAVVRWMGQSYANIYISTDGGNTWTLICERAGGGSGDTIEYRFQIPHIPTRYAKVKVADPLHPSRSWYYDESDTFFTINAVITLVDFNAVSGDSGVVHLMWRTEPGPDELAGYNLYRIYNDGSEERVNDELIAGVEYDDTPRGFVTGYALGAVNGLGEEYRVGEISVFSFDKPIEVVPSIVRHDAIIAFYVPSSTMYSESEQVVLSITDITGRVVRRIIDSELSPGGHIVKFERGDLPAGVYFATLRVNNEIMRVSKLIIQGR